MRWIKFAAIAVVLLLAFYTASASFAREGRTFTVNTSIAYPIDRIYSQFSNLQNFTRWVSFFSDSKQRSYRFFSPYEGQGSSMRYQDQDEAGDFGEMFVRFANPSRSLRYQLYIAADTKPYLIDLKFRPEKEKTQVIWTVTVPPQPWWKSIADNFSEDEIKTGINRSMKNLYSTLGNKVQKERLRENIKFDSLMIEEKESQLLLGVNVSTKNTKDLLFKNIVINHNKTLNFIKTDMAKKEDEYGEPVLITNPDHFKDKEVSYFYGIPLSAKTRISDNNFTFRSLNASRNYVVYYRGPYSGRTKAIQQILQQAKRDTLRTGDLQQTFIEEPTAENNTVLKLAVPVFR